MSQVTRRSIAHRYSTSVSTSMAVLSNESVAGPSSGAATNLYKELQDLEEQDGVIRNNDFIWCIGCDSFIDNYDGIHIRNCLHQICIHCIRKIIIECPNVEVQCPSDACDYYLEDREIRSLLTHGEYEIHIRKYDFPGNENTNNENLYQELLDLEAQGTIGNADAFECEICFTTIQPYDGVVIRECLHQFCIDCTRNTIMSCEEAEITCPAINCAAFINDREIRSLLTQNEFDKYNAKSLRIAESKATNSYHCKKPNCEGWCIVEDAVNTFVCPRCYSQNCLGCQAIHLNQNCKEYQEELLLAGMNDDQRSEFCLDEIVRKNKGMRCSTCKIVIMKRTGCDALVCSMCKTELCWATKGPRWGPRGRGDTSGGCGCTKEKRCHPKCINCH